ncbi:aromatic compound dioxygenase [Epithele typhae]|uniref:aromatic compound dioxygenase n=1 Tax=Epithele typhae TaxID=378194 RepID=UPI0020089DFF|nr:aromatic compound dioxygenase [Epithele typhae]KAH9946231.1 aromatic compound dioxygenase [Epithele typhae]
MPEHTHGKATSNGIPLPDFELPYPDKPEVITENLMKLAALTKDDRARFLKVNLIRHLHQFITETSLTTKEWMSAIQFLTATGKQCTDIRQEFILLSDVLGVSALVDAVNNPPMEGVTESCVLGPFFTEDAPDVEIGESIASEGKGEYMYVEGRILSSDGKPIPDAVIETWETDESGYYDTQYDNRDKPDCRGRLKSDKDGHFAFRAVVPVAYPIPADGPVGDLLLLFNRHNVRPNHLHLMIQAPGYRTLITSFYPENDKYLASDPVFGVKHSLVVSLEEVKNEAEARKRGFPKGDTFKLLKRDIVLVPEDQAQKRYEENAAIFSKNALKA